MGPFTYDILSSRPFLTYLPAQIRFYPKLEPSYDSDIFGKWRPVLVIVTVLIIFRWIILG